MTFNKLNFKQKHNQFNAHHTFENGWTISVSAGEIPYSSPRAILKSHELYTSFEVALFDPDNEFATESIFPEKHSGGVLTWQSRDQIDQAILITSQIKK